MARWYRGPLTNEQMGRVFFNAAPNEGFNMQATRQGGTLWGRNSANAAVLSVYGNGWRLLDDVDFDVFTYLANPRVGYMALGHAGSMDNTGTANLPVTRLTLVHSTGPASGTADPLRIQRALRAYRPWMRNGTSHVGNGNWAYVGQRNSMTGTTEVSDSTDLVIGVGDDAPIIGASHFNTISFRFTTDPTLANVGSAGTLEGLELARFRPFRMNATSPVEGFFGIGDYANSGGQLPEERLDVLDKTIRARQLPTAAYLAPTTDDDKVVVVRTDGRLNWRDASTLGGAADCDWDILGAGASILAGAHNTTLSATCPDEQTQVGIGTAAPATGTKLDVRSGLFPTTVAVNNTTVAAVVKGIEVNASGATTDTYGIDVGSTSNSTNVYNRGIHVEATGPANRSRGVVAVTNGATNTAYAGDFTSNDVDANLSVGVQGLSTGGSNNSTGVWGISLDADALDNVGVRGVAEGSAANEYYGVKGIVDVSATSA